ncbi:hypothetical protein KGF56_001951 [Candida oxycetoniae]|uniref:alpha-1,2-Mannosidase n=1 Tax=Candida oxycetoniae TaxID=497107 RepID=A0AAI9SYP6_9ASCO|nr:uncharacterized protein KGF56_001951 [Candida oxycetoniae]KAI3405236.2 hypothetical protein KGF56_001951 [Candida oxycetoniae]
MLFRVINNHLYVVIYILCLNTSGIYSSSFNSSFTPEHLRFLRNETKGLFQHAWSSYMTYGFPYDEVRPLTCEPYGPDYTNPMNTVRNDAMANISSTLLDNLDTLIIMEQWDELEFGLNYLKSNKEEFFIQNSVVQVFETTIRFLGGLLSAHLLLSDVTNKNISLPKSLTRFRKLSDNYDGFLLEMAYDLGLRLIPSYKTATSIPVPRVNLASGLASVPPALQKDACTSGVTSPVLEFTLLSKLTGDYQFEYYSQQSLWKLWSSRSPLNLLPMTIDPISNQWKDSVTGIGASIDSFYEYAAKGAILFDDDDMWSVFKTSYQALLTHSAQVGEGSMIFPNIGAQDGMIFSDWIDSLSAFWSGLQVLTGQLTDAIKTHIVYLKIWDYFDSIPERWIYSHHNNKSKKKVFKAEDSIELEWYPLRPEFIESTYYLFRATRDPMYLHIGERVFNLFKDRFKAPCGFSGVQDVRTGERQNRMETFVMGETLKYLYLLFDVFNEAFLHKPELMHGKNWVFSTEAHPLWFHKGLVSSTVNPFHKLSVNGGLKTNEFSSAIARNLTEIRPKLTDIPNNHSTTKYHIEKRNPFGRRFEMCEFSPFTKPANSFLHSSFYNWKYLFNADFAFSNSLKKPEYANKTNLDGSYIELEKSFFQKFTLFDTPLMCPRIHTTKFFEIFWGDIKECRNIEVSELTGVNLNEKDSPASSGDLWVPVLQGLRIVFEELSVGKVDSTNTVIKPEYLQSLIGEDDASNKKQQSSALPALRIKRVNGVEVKVGSVVWTMPFELGAGDKNAVGLTNKGRVAIEGKVIENLQIWHTDI